MIKDKYYQWMKSNYKDYIEDGELNCTRLAEACQDHFGVATDLGDTELEVHIFELAVDVETNYM